MRAFLLAASIVTAASGLLTAAAPATVAVREATPGVYTVAATFDVAETTQVAREVLTDYANIPRFLPDIRTSNVLERTADGVRVAQEAVSKFMLFSKRVHLVLDIHETSDAITFRDVCGKSFVRYEGAWRLTPLDQGTRLTYELTAQPSFGVPQFLIGRLLERDARDTIERLRAEIVRRGNAQGRPG
jgi:hypothetical protein